METIETINVIKVNTKTNFPEIIKSFNTSSKAIIEAEELFIKTCKSITEEMIDSDMSENILDDGVYESGDYIINLHWSKMDIYGKKMY